MVPSGTLIDASLCTEKRGIIKSVEQVRELREQRNRIAHEYEWVALPKLFDLVFELTPRLLNLCESTHVSAEQRLSLTEE